MAEKEYVEREKAFDAVFGQFCASSDETEASLNAAIEEIRAIPAADVRPVVLCRDCKHWTRIKKDCILASCDLDALVRCEDFYCANGEKREES